MVIRLIQISFALAITIYSTSYQLNAWYITTFLAITFLLLSMVRKPFVALWSRAAIIALLSYSTHIPLWYTLFYLLLLESFFYGSIRVNIINSIPVSFINVSFLFPFPSTSTPLLLVNSFACFLIYAGNGVIFSTLQRKIVIQAPLFIPKQKRIDLRKMNIPPIPDTLRADPLTNLLHIHAFNHVMDFYVHAERNKENCWMIALVDCDNFREVNIRLGNEVGDQIIRLLASDLTQKLPSNFVIGRTGSCFYIGCHASNQEQIQQEYERLKRSYQEEYDIHLIYSHAVYGIHGKTRLDLIKSAELGLWEMKREIWRKQEEQTFRSEKLAAIGELAAGMAHEIRNPLTTIRGFIQMAQQANMNMEAYYPILIQEVDRMNSIIVEFLNYSRKIDKANMQVYQLNHCVSQSLILVNSVAARDGHS